MIVLLQILKVIGMLLLCLLGFVLLALLLVLFCPIVYRMNGEIHETSQVKISVSWLFHFISFRYERKEGKNTVALHILGWKLFPKRTVAKDGRMPVKTANADRAEVPMQEVVPEESIPKEDLQQGSVGKTDEFEEEFVDCTDAGEDKNGEEAKPNRNLFFRIKEIRKNWQRKYRNFKRNLHKYKTILNDTYNKAAFAHLKKEFIRLLKAILPHKLKLVADYSTGSPDTTGQILGILAIFPIGYQNRWVIHPDFVSDRAYVDGSCDVRGHIFLFMLVGIILRIFFDKKCRRLYSMMTK